ncbi:MAG: ATP-binding protein [Acidobacteriota bacterium]|jgi:serine/threonine-protein kinase RsbW|nr:ATP-binding protein [Acidobacteriota bacterium]
MVNAIEVMIGSALDNLDLVQALTDSVTAFMKFDEDAAHWVGMSVRESVTNAIQHGNKLDLDKKVEISYGMEPERLTVTVRDQGGGFQADAIPNPLEGDNLLKPSGRGIFYMRTFMDEVDFRPLATGGTEVHMVKMLKRGTSGSL